MKEALKEMPDQETLEAFLGGMRGKPRVIFDTREGKLRWLQERPNADPATPHPGSDVQQRD
jgi:hypothetical protein